MANNIVNKYAPIITEKLDYSSIEMYLLKYGVITNQECTSHQKIIQNGTLTNGDLVRTKLIEKIFQKPREFYRALREHVNGKTEDVDPGNKELLRSLPESFVSVATYCAICYYKLLRMEFVLLQLDLVVNIFRRDKINLENV